MPWWEAILDSFGAVAVLIALAFVFLFARRRWLGRTSNTFECSVRMRPPTKGGAAAARGWILGLGRYSGDNLEWFRVFSFSPRPRQVFTRSMRVRDRRIPHGAEAFALYAGHQIIELDLANGQRVEIAMAESTLTGFLAWTEASPPGHDRLLN